MRVIQVGSKIGKHKNPFVLTRIILNLLSSEVFLRFRFPNLLTKVSLVLPTVQFNYFQSVLRSVKTDTSTKKCCSLWKLFQKLFLKASKNSTTFPFAQLLSIITAILNQPFRRCTREREKQNLGQPASYFLQFLLLSYVASNGTSPFTCNFCTVELQEETRLLALIISSRQILNRFSY
jgi:hypothetical protein